VVTATFGLVAAAQVLRKLAEAAAPKTETSTAVAAA
jgi:tRNA A37 threonylcarbamoyladenosine dehydratase